MIDPRIAIATHALTTHATAAVRRPGHPRGEHFTCKCGAQFDGPGAIREGHVHTVVELLAGLDAAMAVAS